MYGVCMESSQQIWLKVEGGVGRRQRSGVEKRGCLKISIDVSDMHKSSPVVAP